MIRLVDKGDPDLGLADDVSRRTPILQIGGHRLPAVGAGRPGAAAEVLTIGGDQPHQDILVLLGEQPEIEGQAPGGGLAQIVGTDNGPTRRVRRSRAAVARRRRARPGAVDAVTAVGGPIVGAAPIHLGRIQRSTDPPRQSGEDGLERGVEQDFGGVVLGR